MKRGARSVKLKILLSAAALFVVAAGPVSSLEFPGLDLFGGMTWMGNGENEGGPSPLMGVWGADFPIQFTPLLSLEPELSLFGTQYQLTTDETKAVPTEIEYAHSLWFLFVMLDVPLRFTFQLTEQLSLAAGPHLAFLFRIPTIGWGDASARTGDREYRSAIVSYLYQNLRFFYPGTDVGLNWRFSKAVGFFFRVFTQFPLFHAWDGEEAPFHDQFLLSFRIGLRFHFHQPLLDPEKIK